MKNTLQIYLGGKMSGLDYKTMSMWRREVATQLFITSSYFHNTKLCIIDPVTFFNFEEKRHQTELEVMKFDLAKVKSSDILIVNLDGLNTSIGTCIECYEAYKKEIPVLAFGSEELYSNLHPWIQCCITRHDKTYLDTVQYIKDFYMT